MLVLLSPAKSLNFETQPPELPFPATNPTFCSQTQTLIQRCQQFSVSELEKLMHISEKLAILNQQRFAHWHSEKADLRPALFAFDGDVYHGLTATTLSESALTRASQQLRILSGLYGLLKPFDLIQPYRLEMGTALQVDHTKNLYEFWHETLTAAVNQELASKTALLNLASQEYFKVLDRKKMTKPIIDVVFLDQKEKNAPYKIISFYAKKARGLMARFVLQNDVKTIEALRQFDLDGYQFDLEESSDLKLCFKRACQK